MSYTVAHVKPNQCFWKEYPDNKKRFALCIRVFAVFGQGIDGYETVGERLAVASDLAVQTLAFLCIVHQTTAHLLDSCWTREVRTTLFFPQGTRTSCRSTTSEMQRMGATRCSVMSFRRRTAGSRGSRACASPTCRPSTSSSRKVSEDARFRTVQRSKCLSRRQCSGQLWTIQLKRPHALRSSISFMDRLPHYHRVSGVLYHLMSEPFSCNFLAAEGPFEERCIFIEHIAANGRTNMFKGRNRQTRYVRIVRAFYCVLHGATAPRSDFPPVSATPKSSCWSSTKTCSHSGCSFSPVLRASTSSLQYSHSCLRN